MELAGFSLGRSGGPEEGEAPPTRWPLAGSPCQPASQNALSCKTKAGQEALEMEDAARPYI